MHSSRWNNPDLKLFHGTSRQYAKAIVQRVDVSFPRQKMGDFGQGFYCTTIERQARVWSKNFVLHHQPAVVTLTVPRSELARLSSLVFLRGDRNDEDYWSFVEFCRKGGRNHGRPAALGKFDAVFGPISVDYENRFLKTGMDQISFHTAEAEILLNTVTERRIL